MHVKELSEALATLREIYEVGGTSKTAKEISNLIEQLAPHADKTVEALVEQMRPIDAKLDVVVCDVAAFHANALLAAGANEDQYHQAFRAMKADRNVKTPEIVEIANRYKNAPLGETFRYKFDTRKKAEDFIFDTFLGRAQAVSKFEVIDRMFKWG